jgi:hypothetical protein
MAGNFTGQTVNLNQNGLSVWMMRPGSTDFQSRNGGHGCIPSAHPSESTDFDPASELPQYQSLWQSESSVLSPDVAAIRRCEGQVLPRCAQGTAAFVLPQHGILSLFPRSKPECLFLRCICPWGTYRKVGR